MRIVVRERRQREDDLVAAEEGGEGATLRVTRGRKGVQERISGRRVEALTEDDDAWLNEEHSAAFETPFGGEVSVEGFEPEDRPGSSRVDDDASWDDTGYGDRDTEDDSGKARAPQAKTPNRAEKRRVVAAAKFEAAASSKQSAEIADKPGSKAASKAKPVGAKAAARADKASKVKPSRGKSSPVKTARKATKQIANKLTKKLAKKAATKKPSTQLPNKGSTGVSGTTKSTLKKKSKAAR